MEADEFRVKGKEVIDFIADYLETIQWAFFSYKNIFSSKFLKFFLDSWNLKNKTSNARCGAGLFERAVNERGAPDRRTVGSYIWRIWEQNFARRNFCFSFGFILIYWLYLKWNGTKKTRSLIGNIPDSMPIFRPAIAILRFLASLYRPASALSASHGPPVRRAPSSRPSFSTGSAAWSTCPDVFCPSWSTRWRTRRKSSTTGSDLIRPPAIRP